MYLSDQDQKRWWQQRLESTRTRPDVDAEAKKHLLERLTAAEGLERYLATKYVGQKRFSLEGGESFIVAMDTLVQRAGALGIQEVVIGMAHRGRLNVLVNTLGKRPQDLFDEFEGKHADDLPSGDVKYHQGFSSDVSTPGGPVHLSLAFNPSHLEIVNPVIEGSTRARLDRRGDALGETVLPVLVHGDASFAGQGVVMETLALAQTRGYTTGGTVHIVINNQIGFTTSDPRDARSTLYCTDVAKMIEAPILHVNGDDPESVAFATSLALDYRKQFHHDVVVDIVCFRKLGHNEQDTPAVTQPLMYKKIAAHPGARKVYADRLVSQGVIAAADADQLVHEFRAEMESGISLEPVLTNYKSKYAVDWSPYLNRRWIDSILSEEAVLGFEYGYSTADPRTLVIWEAQFGDFANGAQVLIDQFISAGEVKWGRACGLTLMLPHGYEGQGPEHSSARLERYLQLCAETNMQVCQPTNPSQIFHLLRRQMLRPFRKPLIIMTPKSLLRHPHAKSPLSDLANSRFEVVLPEVEELQADKVKRIVACSGRVYYDLLAARAERKIDDVAIIRLEQLYPFPHKAFAAEVKRYPNARDIVWCQDEPQNQGAWFFVQHHIHENMLEGQKLGYAGRPASASTAVGYYAKHAEQQKELLSAAFGKLKGYVLTR
jgi:2-oxoglutarate dehydrogenase complex dehydrogenase (E1) component-like enzyme